MSSNIRNALERYGIIHPVVNDNNAILWKKFLISCWPTFMVLDPRGKPIRKFVGEGHRDELIEFVKVAEDFYKELGLYDGECIFIGVWCVCVCVSGKSIIINTI